MFFLLFKHESVAVEMFRSLPSFPTKFFIEKAVFHICRHQKYQENLPLHFG